jgi:protein-S-isoprenylcysteine O-methyltransferase Ste14
MVQSLNLVGWLACIVYSTIPSFWLAIHPRAKYWRSRRPSPYRVLLPLWITMWIAAGLVTATWRQVVLYSNFWTWVPAAFLFGAGFWLYSRSGQHFSVQQLSGIPEVMAGASEQRLITTGIHSRVRHPVYLAHFCVMLAWSLGTGLAVCYALTAFALLSGAVMIKLEDQELQQRFGEDFHRYKSSVPAILPRLH